MRWQRENRSYHDHVTKQGNLNNKNCRECDRVRVIILVSGEMFISKQQRVYPGQVKNKIRKKVETQLYRLCQNICCCNSVPSSHTKSENIKRCYDKKKTTTNDNNNRTPNKEIRPETTTITKNPPKIVTKSQTKIHSRNNFDTNVGIFILFVRSFSQKSSLSGMYTTGIRFPLPQPMPFAIIR